MACRCVAIPALLALAGCATPAQAPLPFMQSTAAVRALDSTGAGKITHVIYIVPKYVDYDGLGFRVLLLVISPYAKAGHVSHVHYETASVLRFAEDLLELPQMATADARANSPAGDCFDFSQNPRTFVPIAAPYPAKFFLHHRFDDYFATYYA